MVSVQSIPQYIPDALHCQQFFFTGESKPSGQSGRVGARKSERYIVLLVFLTAWTVDGLPWIARPWHITPSRGYEEGWQAFRQGAPGGVEGYGHPGSLLHDRLTGRDWATPT